MSDSWPQSGDIVVADLEYTSWEGALERGWSGPGEHRELVQIGAVRLDAGAGFAESEAFEMLVRPAINPHLSDYFTALTGIDNAALAARGVALAAALAEFAHFAGDAGIYSNGPDSDVIAESCRLADTANILPAVRWRDVGDALGMFFGGGHVSSYRIPELLGLPPVAGRAHDALSDARAIAAGLRHWRVQGLI